jgi:hypothetical protein
LAEGGAQGVRWRTWCARLGPVFCADGVCCNAACTDGCQSCLLADTGKPDGICGDVTVGKDPHHACTGEGNCNGMDKCACQDGLQDFGETDVDCGGGQCPKCAQGKMCGLPTDCTTGHCADVLNAVGVCCDTACADACHSCRLGAPWQGTCTPVLIGTKGNCPTGQVCNASQMCVQGQANGQQCASNGDCVSGRCSLMVCVANQPNGADCSINADCANGMCANHVCQ